MSAQEPDRRVRWYTNKRGPRVAIDIGCEDVVTTPDAARKLREDLTAVLDEIAADHGSHQTSAATDRQAHSDPTGALVDEVDRLSAECRRLRRVILEDAGVFSREQIDRMMEVEP